MLKWISFFFILLLQAQAWAVGISCVKAASKGALGGRFGYGTTVDTQFYRPFERLLFLSDGLNGKFGVRGEARDGGLSLGEVLAEAFPNKQITASDFLMDGAVKDGNLLRVFADNSQTLPFADQSLDFVGLRKGLCLCCGHKPCGGFDSKFQKAKSFFTEIIRVLDTDNPEALAVLHGQEFSKPKVVARWQAIAEELEREFPVEISFGFAPPGWGFKDGDHGPEAQPRLTVVDPNAESAEQGEFNSIFIAPAIRKSELPEAL